jgi:hypothetical protein
MLTFSTFSAIGQRDFGSISSQEADKMSLKSAFSKLFSFESPSVQRELPHHMQTLSRRCAFQIGLFTLIRQSLNPKHVIRIIH